MEASVKSVREALKSILNHCKIGKEYDNVGMNNMYFDGIIGMKNLYFDSIAKLANSALSIPLRNCDVGTVEEKEERFCLWCREHCADLNMTADCANTDTTCSLCAIRWGQMPYKEGVG